MIAGGGDHGPDNLMATHQMRPGWLANMPDTLDIEGPTSSTMASAAHTTYQTAHPALLDGNLALGSLGLALRIMDKCIVHHLLQANYLVHHRQRHHLVHHLMTPDPWNHWD